MIKFLLLPFFLISHLSFATECRPINLITEANSPFEKIPVYDQDGIGICYAYSAAQLIDYHLIKNGASKRSVHPVWLALQVSIKSDKGKLSSGNPSPTIEAVREAKNCDYDLVHSAIGTWAKKANITESEMTSLIEKMNPKFQLLLDGKKAEALLNNTSPNITKDDMVVVLSEAVAEQKDHECSPNPQYENIIPDLYALSILGGPKMFEGLLFPVCYDQRVALNIPRSQNEILTEDNEYPDFIDRKLNELNAPVSIGYCSKALSDKTYDGVVSRVENIILKEDCGNHESLLVGKKKIQDSCHFLLRNSWGNGFADWNQNQSCLCKHKQTGAFVDDCTAQTHNTGEYSVEACWIDEGTIAKNINNVSWLRER